MPVSLRNLHARARALLALAMLCWPLAACAPRDDWQSVVLIVVDTLRADHLGTYGYARPTSPNLDRWSARGTVFETAQAPSPWTLTTFGSLYTGRLPSAHHAGTYALEEGERKFWSLNVELPTLAERLGEQGVVTGAVINNSYLSPRFGIARGFRTYDTEAGESTRFRRADEVVERALAWLDNQGDARTFLTIHLFDPHLSYDAPPPFRGRFTGDATGPRRVDIEEIRRLAREGGEVAEEFLPAAYDEEIAFVDAQLGRLFEAFTQRGLFDRALVLFTADHGEELFDHGGFEHGHTMYQELLRVPLIAWGAGVERRRIDTPVTLLDVYPTVLEALGVGVPEGLRGVSLVPVLTGRAAPPHRTLFAERTLYGEELRAAVDWPWKLIERPSDGKLWLYDLETDGSELRDLAARHPRITERLRRRLREVAREATPPAEGVELDSATREQLRALGYLD